MKDWETCPLPIPICSNVDIWVAGKGEKERKGGKVIIPPPASITFTVFC